MTTYQLKQIEVVDEIERQVKNNSINFSFVAPTEDYEQDPRMCLTSVHFPNTQLVSKIQKELIEPLKRITPSHYYYSSDSLHMTIKTIRVINNPPHFTKDDIVKATEVFQKTIPHHKKFNVYFYRLLLFPSSLALIGTTDEELDNIILDLDRRLKDAGIPDDKIYNNEKYFFSNMTLIRFIDSLSEEFKQKISELSKHLSFEPYQVNSISLVSANAVFKNREIIETWNLN